MQPLFFSLSFYTFQPPRVVTLAILPVEGSGALATITKSVLQVDDPDNPADVLVMVLEPPRHGRLTRLHGDRALSRFKLEELSREQIQYIHDGSEGTEDGVVLQVNDGHSYRNVLLQVHIDQKVGGTEGEDGRWMAQSESLKRLFTFSFSSTVTPATAYVRHTTICCRQNIFQLQLSKALWCLI